MTRALLLLLFTLSIVQGSLDSRIIGGNNAEEGKYPYQVLIKNQDYPVCGGSIISNRYILTAAHCIYKKYQAHITVVAGTIYSMSSGDIYSAEKLIWLNNYNESEFIHDIGLIFVDRNITFNNYVQPVALAPTYYVPTGESAVVTGWGTQLSDSPDAAFTLQELRVTVILQSECKIWFPNVTDFNICTFTKLHEGACFGDSGSPLVLNGVQIGILSYGIPCAMGAPDVYTRVFPYTPWIESVMMSNINHIQLNTWTLLLLTISTLVAYSCLLP